MNSPYRKPHMAGRETARLVGHVLLPSRRPAPAVFRLFFTGALAIVLTYAGMRLFPKNSLDMFSRVVAALWLSITFGPFVGALCDAVVAFSCSRYRRRPAKIVGDTLIYRLWGRWRAVERKDVSAALRCGPHVLLALASDMPSIVFRPLGGAGDLPEWMTKDRKSNQGTFGFVWRARSPVFLGSVGTLAWFAVVGGLMLSFWLWGDSYAVLLLLVPAIAVALVGIILQLVFAGRLHRAAVLTFHRSGWLLHAQAPKKRYFLPVEEEHGLGTGLLRVRIENEEVPWVPGGGALSAEEQATFIAALGMPAGGRKETGETTGGIDESRSEGQ